MSEIFSAQLTAAATLALAALALAAAVLAGLALRKQSLEVSLLLEQNKRDTDERRRTQASRVFLGVPADNGPPVSPYARNASDLPIYDARFWYGKLGGDPSAPEHLGTIMPGGTASAERQFSAHQALKYTVLTFRDAAGLHWVRWPDGVLVWVTEPVSDEQLSAIRQLHEVMPRYDREHRNAAGELMATGGRLRRAARTVLRKRRAQIQA